MFPIYILNTEEDIKRLPLTETYYLVTADGVMEHKLQDMVRSITPTTKIPYLMKVNPAAAMLAPPIPASIAYTVFMFFREVWNVHRAECAVRLFYSLDEQRYQVVCPEQEVSQASVFYHLMPLPGWIFAGTIHSHCDFSAGHSATDEKDEIYSEGFHVVFGHVNCDHFSVATTIVAGQMRFPQEPLETIPCLRYAGKGQSSRFAFDQDEISGIDPSPQIAEWMPRVKPQNYRWKKREQQ